jgi:hypothetical protein
MEELDKGGPVKACLVLHTDLSRTEVRLHLFASLRPASFILRTHEWRGLLSSCSVLHVEKIIWQNTKPAHLENTCSPFALKLVGRFVNWQKKAG